MSKRNKKLASKYHDMECIACEFWKSDPDHILNYSGCKDRDQEFNIWPLCRPCHIRKGVVGLTKFAKENELDAILLERGYWHDGRKWRHSQLGK